MKEILTPGIVGFIECTAEGVVKGWAFNPALDDPITLCMVVDEWEVATTICDAPRPDVAQAGFVREHVGFHFHLPALYFDDAPHVVQIRSSDDFPIVFRNDDGVEQEKLPSPSPLNIRSSCVGIHGQAGMFIAGP